jgi:NAD(P)-dependent dehydrogenase (short-subunit alcohol dehydrogenase family)
MLDRAAAAARPDAAHWVRAPCRTSDLQRRRGAIMASDPFRLNGRSAVITGGGGRIGAAIAHRLAGQGAAVVLVDIDKDALARTASAVADEGGTVHTVHGDVSCPEGVAAAIAGVLETVPQIDILVNNAGRGSHTYPEDLEYDEWAAIFALNLTGYFLVAQAVGRHMIERGVRGAIVMTSSTCSPVAMGRGNFAYSISKSGVNHLVRELALEWGCYGIRVNAIAPCQVDAPSMDRLLAREDPSGLPLRERVLGGIPLGRLATADDMAGPVAFLVSDAAAMVTGTILPVDGGNLACNAASSIRRPVSEAAAT